MKTPKVIERQIDEALLLVATQAAFLYAQRRARRVLPKVAVGAAVLTGVGAAVATAAVGLGAIGVAGGAVAWYRQRAKKADLATPAFDASWRPSGTGPPSASAVGSKSDATGKNVASEPSSTGTRA
jgi:hypothetical protein